MSLEGFAKEFLAEREKLLASGNLNGFVSIYSFLFDKLLSTSPRLSHLNKEEMMELRENFLAEAEMYGLSQMPDA